MLFTESLLIDSFSPMLPGEAECWIGGLKWLGDGGGLQAASSTRSSWSLQLASLTFGLLTTRLPFQGLVNGVRPVGLAMAGDASPISKAAAATRSTLRDPVHFRLGLSPGGPPDRLCHTRARSSVRCRLGLVFFTAF